MLSALFFSIPQIFRKLQYYSLFKEKQMNKGRRAQHALPEGRVGKRNGRDGRIFVD